MPRRRALDRQTRFMCVLVQHYYLFLNAPDNTWTVRVAAAEFDTLRGLVPTLGEPVTALSEVPPENFIQACEHYVLALRDADPWDLSRAE